MDEILHILLSGYRACARFQDFVLFQIIGFDLSLVVVQYTAARCLSEEIRSRFQFWKKSRSISSLLRNIFVATTILPKNFKVKDREEYTSKDCQLKRIPAERHL